MTKEKLAEKFKDKTREELLDILYAAVRYGKLQKEKVKAYEEFTTILKGVM
jgi:hypothetical protein